MRNIIIIIAVVIVLVAAYFIFSSPDSVNDPRPDDSLQDSNNTSDDPQNNDDSSQAQGIEAEIKNFAFSPETITISQGETITWTNMDSVAHTVTSDTGSELDSDLLEKGESFSHTFNTLGTFDYLCTPHPNMQAKVIVE